MNRHVHVTHPRDLAVQPATKMAQLNDWVTDHLALALGSILGLYFALTIPLIALPIPAFSKVVIIVSSNWIQLWGLFCLQRSANRADAKRRLKEDADHEALTHIANTVDRIAGKLGLRALRHGGCVTTTEDLDRELARLAGLAEDCNGNARRKEIVWARIDCLLEERGKLSMEVLYEMSAAEVYDTERT